MYLANEAPAKAGAVFIDTELPQAGELSVGNDDPFAASNAILQRWREQPDIWGPDDPSRKIVQTWNDNERWGRLPYSVQFFAASLAMEETFRTRDWEVSLALAAKSSADRSELLAIMGDREEAAAKHAKELGLVPDHHPQEYPLEAEPADIDPYTVLDKWGFDLPGMMYRIHQEHYAREEEAYWRKLEASLIAHMKSNPYDDPQMVLVRLMDDAVPPVPVPTFYDAFDIMTEPDVDAPSNGPLGRWYAKRWGGRQQTDKPRNYKWHLALPRKIQYATLSVFTALAAFASEHHVVSGIARSIKNLGSALAERLMP